MPYKNYSVKYTSDTVQFNERKKNNLVKSAGYTIYRRCTYFPEGEKKRTWIVDNVFWHIVPILFLHFSILMMMTKRENQS